MLEGTLLRWDFFFLYGKKADGRTMPCRNGKKRGDLEWPLVHVLCGLFFHVLYYF